VVAINALATYATKATGSVQCVAKASVVDSSTEVIGGVSFVYKLAGPGTGTNVDLTSAVSAQDVAVALAAAVNASSSCNCIAGTPVSGLVPITAKLVGQVYNAKLTGTATSVKIGMTGGLDPLSTRAGMRLLQKYTATEAVTGALLNINLSALSSVRIIISGPMESSYTAKLQVDGHDGKNELWYPSGATIYASNQSTLDLGLYGGNGSQGLVDMVYDGVSAWIVEARSSLPDFPIAPYSRRGFGRLPQGSTSIAIVGTTGTVKLSVGASIQVWGM